jgi:sugar phosphate isomerase/epimerase
MSGAIVKLSQGSTKRVRIGFSSTTIGFSSEFERFWALEPECLELCACNTSMWSCVKDLIRSSCIPVGLHCPAPYDGPLNRFDITGPSRTGVKKALTLVRQTVQAAADVGAAYVVVHFPTPYTKEATRRVASAEMTQAYILQVGEELAELRTVLGVPIFIENMSFNPRFGSATDYRWFLQKFPGLRMCLDLGHAHLSSHEDDACAFTLTVAPFVSSLHIYNTLQRGPNAGYHAVPLQSQTVGQGWMDLLGILENLAECARPEFLIFEYGLAGYNDFQDAYRAACWLRQAIERLSWA